MPLSELTVTGINFRTAPVALRECFALEGEGRSTALAEISGSRAREVIIVSTCNRTEIYAIGAPNPAMTDLLRRNLVDAGAPEDSWSYTLRGRAAARHLFRVASGLDSQVLGESEILGQTKMAWAIARDEGASGPLLDTLFRWALEAGKRVRTETELGVQPVSIASLALRQAVELVGDFTKARVLIVGTGEMGRRIARETRDLQPASMTIMSHTLAYASALAMETGGEPCTISRLHELLPTFDVLLTATNAPHPIIDRSGLEPLAPHRADRGLVIVDLGVPRNTAADVRNLDFVTLFDIDDLQAISERHQRSRALAVPDAERIIEEQLDELMTWFDRRSVVPMSTALRAEVERVRIDELERVLRKMGDLTDDQRKHVTALSERISSVLLRSLLHGLRAHANDKEAITAVARVLSIDTDLVSPTETFARNGMGK